MRPRALLTGSLTVVTMVGCAPAKPNTVYDEAPLTQWTGSLQPTQQRTGQLAVTGQNRAFGSVKITGPVGQLKRMHVAVSVAVPNTGIPSLRWAVLPDRCGSGALPLIGFEQFPLIDVTTNGRGQVEADLPLELAPNNSYHINIYNGGQQLENVVTCANLRYEGGKAG